MPSPTIRVLCADDHRLMREGIARIVGVQPDMTVVAQASDGEQAVAQFLKYRPDVTLMDLEMPTMNGVQAIQAIRRHQPDARIHPPVDLLPPFRGRGRRRIRRGDRRRHRSRRSGRRR